jgi:hypothetical protein
VNNGIEVETAVPWALPEREDWKNVTPKVPKIFTQATVARFKLQVTV